MKVGTLVWARVTGHPRWPGQVFDPKDCRNKAVAEHKKGTHLVAFFGDGSFGWFAEADLQGFEENYDKYKAGSKRDKAFLRAVAQAKETLDAAKDKGGKVAYPAPALTPPEPVEEVDEADEIRKESVYSKDIALKSKPAAAYDFLRVLALSGRALAESTSGPLSNAPGGVEARAFVLSFRDRRFKRDHRGDAAEAAKRVATAQHQEKEAKPKVEEADEKPKKDKKDKERDGAGAKKEKDRNDKGLKEKRKDKPAPPRPKPKLKVVTRESSDGDSDGGAPAAKKASGSVSASSGGGDKKKEAGFRLVKRPTVPGDTTAIPPTPPPPASADILRVLRMLAKKPLLPSVVGELGAASAVALLRLRAETFEKKLPDGVNTLCGKARKGEEDADEEERDEEEDDKESALIATLTHERAVFRALHLAQPVRQQQASTSRPAAPKLLKKKEKGAGPVARARPAAMLGSDDDDDDSSGSDARPRERAKRPAKPRAPRPGPGKLPVLSSKEKKERLAALVQERSAGKKRGRSASPSEGSDGGRKDAGGGAAKVGGFVMKKKSSAAEEAARPAPLLDAPKPDGPQLPTVLTINFPSGGMPSETEFKAKLASFKLASRGIPVRIHDKSNTAYITFETGEGARQAHDFVFPRQQQLFQCSGLLISLTFSREQAGAQEKLPSHRQEPPGGAFAARRTYGGAPPSYGGGGGGAGYGGSGGAGGGGYGDTRAGTGGDYGGAPYAPQQRASGFGGGGQDAGGWGRPAGPPPMSRPQQSATMMAHQQQQQPRGPQSMGGYGAPSTAGAYGGVAAGGGYGRMQQGFAQAPSLSSRMPLGGAAPIDPRKAAGTMPIDPRRMAYAHVEQPQTYGATQMGYGAYGQQQQAAAAVPAAAAAPQQQAAAAAGTGASDELLQTLLNQMLSSGNVGMIETAVNEAQRAGAPAPATGYAAAGHAAAIPMYQAGAVPHYAAAGATGNVSSALAGLSALLNSSTTAPAAAPAPAPAPAASALENLLSQLGGGTDP